MSTKYSFGWSEDCAVEIPELDSFLAALKALCRQHGLGFDHERWDECGGYLEIVPFDKADWDIFTDHLDEYRGGVPFLDKAKEKYRANVEAREARDAEKRAAKRTAEKDAMERSLRTKGIDLSDGHYKLVKAD